MGVWGAGGECPQSTQRLELQPGCLAIPIAREIQSRDATEACWEASLWMQGEEGCHIVFIQQMFAECRVCGAGRESQASAAGAGGQEAQDEGGHSPGRRAQCGSQCQVGKTQPQGTHESYDLYSEGDGKLGLGNSRIKAVFVEDWPACVLAEDYSDRVGEETGTFPYLARESVVTRGQ